MWSILSNEKLDNEEQLLFQQNKKVFCAIGRLTRQKNFKELVKFLHKFQEENNKIKFEAFLIFDKSDKHHLHLRMV